MKIRWLDEPEEHDYPAAADYLSLLFTGVEVGNLINALKAEPVRTRKAKDILRASGLPALPPGNVHVGKDLAKAKAGKALSPILLVRGQPLLVADGYHRVCASYVLSEDEDIPCKLVSFPWRNPDVQSP